MYEPVLFPDIVDLLCGYLIDEFRTRGDTGTVIGPRVPNPRPRQLVVLRRLGGIQRNEVTDQPTVVVDTWAERDEYAHDLAQLCRALLHTLVGQILGETPIYRVTEIAGPALLPDPLSASPRYTQTVSVAVRGTVETPGS